MTTALRRGPSGKKYLLTSPTAAAQTNWAVSPSNGSDDASQPGTPSAPLATCAELGRRLSYQPSLPDTNVMLLEDIPESDPLFIVGSALESGASLNLFGTTTTLATATITTVTADAATGGSPWQIVTSGVDWTLLGLGTRLRWSGGARDGSIAWVGQVVGANTIRISSVEGSILTGANQTPVAGDVIVAESLSKLPSVSLDVATNELLLPVTPFTTIPAAPVNLVDLELSDTSVRSASRFSMARLFGCIARNAEHVFVTLDLRSCYRDCGFGTEFAVYEAGELLIVTGGLFADSLETTFQGWIPNSNSTWMNDRPWMMGVGLYASQPVLVDVQGGGLHVEGFAFSGVDLSSGARLTSIGKVTGSSTIGGSIGIVAGSGSLFQYLSSKKPTLTGATSPTKVGGTNTVYASIPAVNANNFAGIVVLA